MQTTQFSFGRLSVGKKITGFTFGLVLLIFAAFVLFNSYSSARIMEDEAFASMKNEARSTTDIIEIFSHAQIGNIHRFYTAFEAEYQGAFALDTSKVILAGSTPTPALFNGDSAINLQFDKVDQYSQRTGVTATVFVKKGDDFVRISTSVKKENGERAVGTMLDRQHPAYAHLMSGKGYRGMAILFGKQFVTEYQPVFDTQRKVVGVLYVGVDISQDMELLKEKIRKLKIGESGFFYVLDARPGKDFGTLIVHPSQQGKNLLDAKDHDGREYIREILEKKNGMLRYNRVDTGLGETSPHERIVVFETNPDFRWTVVGVTLSTDIVKHVVQLRNLSAFFGVIAIVLFVLALHMLVKRSVTQPLMEARNAATRLAAGDLTAVVTVHSEDEIGQLGAAINGISKNLTEVIGTILESAQNVTDSAGEIASSNMDLSGRTEQQASSLEETASSMEELTSTVRQNADNAREASAQAMSASDIAGKGGVEMNRMVDTMNDISSASHKIGDIIGVIDGIAFQTNILALNAAVEAARAGEKGRGFAVVATEVRSLAGRSAEAAKQIKALVLQSTDKVSIGTSQVKAAGQTMTEIVRSVQAVTTLINEISTASHEQSSGIEQFNSAIGNMERTTQQNAALVEQVAAAAASMSDQATTLSELVHQFRLAEVGTTHDRR
jgi:methyl-accepting chemotaxis protein